MDLATGATVDEGTLAGVVSALPSATAVDAVTERLILPTQVDASTAAETILVRGEITGADFAAGEPAVNAYHAVTGRSLAAEDAGYPVVMLERNFARFYSLPDTGEIAISGERRLEYVGQASTPEYFSVAPEGEMFMSEATFAGLFTTLETAQELAGLPGAVNNLVLTLHPQADRDAVAGELACAIETLPVGATVSTRDDNLSYTALTTDIDQDQAMFNALAVLLFAGAVGAAFNLIHRLAEQQRREIGIGMALGVRPALLAVRPLLVSAQIALLGAMFGVGVGMMIGNGMGAVFRSLIPLPVWDTSLQTGLFAQVAIIGLVVPFVAAIIPIWRAVRVAPIAAIKPSYLSGGRIQSDRRRRRIHNTFAVMPLRNLRRSPRRTVLTALGIAAAITVLVGFLGIMDSVFGAVDTAEREATGAAPDRITVGLDTFHPVVSQEVRAVTEAETVAVAEAALRLPGAVRVGGEEIDVFVQLADLDDGMWRPSLIAGELSEAAGVLLTEKAAADLGVDVGDAVILRHPRREGVAGFAIVESEVAILGIDPYPARGFVYMDIDHSGLFNLEGITNSVNVRPAAGFVTGDVQRELFTLGHVSSVQAVTTVTQAVREAFDQILAIIQIMVVAVLLLALLIAFNTAAINLEARAREHATMFAFGVKVRTALRMAMTESLLVGVAATALGVAGGFVMVWWMTQRLLPETLPDFGLHVVVQAETLAAVAVMGIVAVTLAPLLTLRRMRRMNLPGTLRLVE